MKIGDTYNVICSLFSQTLKKKTSRKVYTFKSILKFKLSVYVQTLYKVSSIHIVGYVTWFLSLLN